MAEAVIHVHADIPTRLKRPRTSEAISDRETLADNFTKIRNNLSDVTTNGGPAADALRAINGVPYESLNRCCLPPALALYRQVWTSRVAAYLARKLVQSATAAG